MENIMKRQITQSENNGDLLNRDELVPFFHPDRLELVLRPIVDHVGQQPIDVEKVLIELEDQNPGHWDFLGLCLGIGTEIDRESRRSILGREIRRQIGDPVTFDGLLDRIFGEESEVTDE